jgi:1-deoxy-D-xylulose-5-phosphate synthase
MPGLGKITYGGLSSIRNFIRRKVAYGSIFEELGFKYYGPVDGHDMSELVKVFLAAKENDEPTVIHCITKKGKGYPPAENLPDKFHGVSSFNAESGLSKKNSAATYSDVYGEKLCELAGAHGDVVGVTAAMTGGTGMDKFSIRFPERFYDTAIAESHAVSFAAGLALKGMKPFLNIYSTFLQRAYDNVMMDVCLMRLPVVFVLDRAGLVGEDGETHQGIFDISYLSHMPNMTIIAPSSKERFLEAMDYAYGHDGPVAIRIPRGEAAIHKTSASLWGVEGEPPASERGAEEVAGAVVILAFGRMVKPAAEVSERLVKEGKKAVALDMHFVKPLDEKMILDYANAAEKIVTVEDNVATGGVGERIASLLEKRGAKTPLVSIAFPDKFIEHGSTPELFARYKMDADGIYQSIMES